MIRGTSGYWQWQPHSLSPRLYVAFICVVVVQRANRKPKHINCVVSFSLRVENYSENHSVRVGSKANRWLQKKTPY